MFEKILIAYRGDQLPCGGAAAQPNCSMAEGQQSGFATEAIHV